MTDAYCGAIVASSSAQACEFLRKMYYELIHRTEPYERFKITDGTKLLKVLEISDLKEGLIL